jgi:two-component system nitrate/nitrite response regulator NarL
LIATPTLLYEKILMAEFVGQRDTLLRKKMIVIPQDILRHLVKQISCSAAKVPPQTTQVTDEVILECEMEGACYYLVRRQLQTHRKIFLSPRESAIAKLVAQGLPNKSIGQRLEISPWTVATHIRRIFDKLKVSSRAAMIAQLAQENMLSESDN